jgi:hypothetical protein
MKLLFLIIINLSYSFSYAAKNKVQQAKNLILLGEFNQALAVVNANSDQLKKENLFHQLRSQIFYLKNDFNQASFELQKIIEPTIQSCSLKIALSLREKKWEGIFADWRSCKNLASEDSMQSLFLDILIEGIAFGKEQSFSTRRFALSQNNLSDITAWFKASLFLDASEITEEFSLDLPTSMYDDQNLRKIITQVLFDAKKARLANEMNNNTNPMLTINFDLIQERFAKSLKAFNELSNSFHLGPRFLEKMITLNFYFRNYGEVLKLSERFLKYQESNNSAFLWKYILSLVKKEKTDKARAYLKQSFLSSYTQNRSHYLLKALQSDDLKTRTYIAKKLCSLDVKAACWNLVENSIDSNQIKDKSDQEKRVFSSIEEIIEENKRNFKAVKKEENQTNSEELEKIFQIRL